MKFGIFSPINLGSEFQEDFQTTDQIPTSRKFQCDIPYCFRFAFPTVDETWMHHM